MAPKTFVETIEKHAWLNKEEFLHHREQKDYLSRDDTVHEWERMVRTPDSRTLPDGTVQVWTLLSRKRRIVSEE